MIKNVDILTACLFYDSKMVDPRWDIFDKYYMALVETKDFYALINNKSFFDQPVKNKQHEYVKLKCQEMMTIQQEIY